MNFLPMLLHQKGITISESIYSIKIRGKRKFIHFNDIKSIKYKHQFRNGHSFSIILENNKKITQYYYNPEDFQLIKKTYATYLKNTH